MKEDIVYLYINSFAYKQAKHGKAMGGHPVPGRIYRALYDKETTQYRLLLDEMPPSGMAGLILKDLSGECGNWTAEITKLDDENVLSLEIESEDFEKLARWKETEEDIDPLRIEHVHQVEQGVDGQIAMQIERPEVEDDHITISDTLGESLSILVKEDPELAKGLEAALQGIALYITTKTNNAPDLGRVLGNHPLQGSGVNMGLAVDAIDEYMNVGHPFAAGSLSKAVYYLLVELARINK